MIKKEFWQVLIVSFLSAAVAVLGFAFLVEAQIDQLQQKIDNLEELVERYGVGDEIAETNQTDIADDTQLTLNLIKNANYSLDSEFEQTTDFRLTNGEYIFDCGENFHCQVFIDLTDSEDQLGKEYLFADLDQSGNEQALVVVTLLSYNGSQAKYLVVLEGSQGKANFVDSQIINLDRVNQLEFSDKKIVINGIAADQLSCCSNEQVELKYIWQNQKLKKID